MVHLISNCTVTVRINQIYQGWDHSWECFCLFCHWRGENRIGAQCDQCLWGRGTSYHPENCGTGNDLGYNGQPRLNQVWFKSRDRTDQVKLEIALSSIKPVQNQIFRDFTAFPIWLMGKLFYLITNGNFLCYSLWLLTSILRLSTSQKSVIPSSVKPPSGWDHVNLYFLRCP